MKTLYYFIIVICVPLAARAQKAACKDFHNGDFKVIDSVHNSMVLIERRDSIEIEYLYKHITDTAYDMKLVFKVNWLSDCKYQETLIYNYIHTRKGDKHLPPSDRVLVNEIVAGDNTGCVIRVQMNDANKTSFYNRLWKMRD